MLNILRFLLFYSIFSPNFSIFPKFLFRHFQKILYFFHFFSDYFLLCLIHRTKRSVSTECAARTKLLPPFWKVKRENRHASWHLYLVLEDVVYFIVIWEKIEFEFSTAIKTIWTRTAPRSPLRRSSGERCSFEIFCTTGASSGA